jgi:hypothetical protein
VKCAFGILSNKWRIFQQPLNVSSDFAVDIVKTCVVLHSSVREMGNNNSEDAMRIAGLQDVPDRLSICGGGFNRGQCKDSSGQIFSKRAWNCFLVNVKNMNSRVYNERR